MGKIKVLTITICVCFMTVFGISLVQAEGSKTMTNVQFADILFRIIELVAPEGSEELSDAEFFKIQANMLAERGVTVFIDAKPGDLVTSGILCNVLGSSIEGLPDNMGIGMVPTRGSVSNVFNRSLLGYGGEESMNEMNVSVAGLGCPADNGDRIMEYDEVVRALNVPALSSVVAEAYTGPGEAPKERGRKRRGRRKHGPQKGIGHKVKDQNPIPEELKCRGPASPTGLRFED